VIPREAQVARAVAHRRSQIAGGVARCGKESTVVLGRFSYYTTRDVVTTALINMV